MTRKSYKRKKEINKAWVKVKKVLIIFFIGFMCGLVYSNLFIGSDLIAKAETSENKKVIQIDQEEEKPLKSQKNAELESLEKVEGLSNECTLDEGIEAYISNLKNNYYNEGRTTIETIQLKYAPIGAKNDPNDLNSNWIPGVTRHYKELGGK